MSKILVSDIMTREPLTMKPNASLLECAKKMVQKKTGTLLLSDKKKLVGLISRHDILWALMKKSKEDLSKIEAKDISPKKIAVIRPSATLDEAIKKIKDLKFAKLPVIDNNKIVGIVTIKDILSFHPELYPELEEFASIREESEKLKLVKKAKERIIVREGICEKCGTKTILNEFDGMNLCESCQNSQE